MRLTTPRRAAALAAVALSAVGTASAEARFYASSVSYCSSSRAIEVDRFLFEYLPDFKPYGAFKFDISAASVESNLDASLNFELQAYGLHIVNTTIDLCSLVAGLLCPLPQYDFVGSATIPLSQSIGGDINLPGIAYWIPNLDATANIRLIRVEDGTEAACLKIDLSNGKTVRHAWVSWILGGFVFLCLLLTALWFLVGTLAYPSASLLAPASPLAANAAWASLGRRKERLFLLFSLYQFVATTGLLSLDYPNVYLAWTGNYAWALGLIREKPVVNAIDRLRARTGGDLTRIAGSSGIVGGTQALQGIYAQSYVVPDASPLAQEVASSLLTEVGKSYALTRGTSPTLTSRSLEIASGLFAKRQLDTISQAAAEPVPVVGQQESASSWLHQGIPHWILSLDMSPYDAYMVVFINFLFLCAIAIALILLGGVFWALLRFTSRRRAEKRRRALGISRGEDEKRGAGAVYASGRFGRARGAFSSPFWTVVRANTLRLLLIAWYPLLLFTFFQWTIGSSDSYAPIVLSAVTIACIALALLVLAIRFIILARRAFRRTETSYSYAEDEVTQVGGEKAVSVESPFRPPPAMMPVTPNPDPKHALKKAERREVETYSVGSFLGRGLGPYSPFWNAYKVRSRRTTASRRNWWKGRGWWFGLLDLVVAPLVTALFVGFAVSSGWVQSVALLVIQVIVFLAICIWSPFEDKSSNFTHIFWAGCRVAIAGALIALNASITISGIARAVIGFVLAVIEMVLAVLFAILLVIDLIQLIVFLVRGIKARRRARRGTVPAAGYAVGGDGGLPQMQERTAMPLGGPMHSEGRPSRGSNSSDTLANSPNPQAYGGHDFATAPPAKMT